MNIYLPIEVKARELEGKMLLALEASKRGHTVVIGKKQDSLNLAVAGKLPPGIVHDKSLTPGEYKIRNFEKLKKHGHAITAQDEESGLLDESFDKFAKQRFSEETISLTDRVFAWGKHDASSLKRIYPEYADRIVETGSPRVDFWRQEFAPYFSLEKERSRPFLLVASNFGFPIDENPFWNKVARLRGAGYFDRDPDMEQFMYENSAYQYRLLYRFIEAIRKLSDDFPQIDIVVRPHPVESLDAWNKLMGEYKNVFIERKGTISRLIRHSFLLMHNGCTSALEASVSNTPRVAYRPIPHEIEREIPNETSIHAFSYQELKETVECYFDGRQPEKIEDISKKTDKIISDRLASTSGRFAAEKIVDEWEKLQLEMDLSGTNYRDLIAIFNEVSKNRKRKQMLQNLKVGAVNFRNFFTGQKRDHTRQGNLLKTSHKFPFLNMEEVKGIISSIRKVTGTYNEVKAVQFGKNSYVLFKDK
jgi:surface carbohydrate biosynthesis protein